MLFIFCDVVAGMCLVLSVHTMNHWWLLETLLRSDYYCRGLSVCVCLRQLVSVVPRLLLRKKEKVPVMWLWSQDGCHKSRWVGACPFQCTSFHSHTEGWWWMAYVHFHCSSRCRCAPHDPMKQCPQIPGKLSTYSLNDSVKAWTLSAWGVWAGALTLLVR